MCFHFCSCFANPTPPPPFCVILSGANKLFTIYLLCIFGVIIWPTSSPVLFCCCCCKTVCYRGSKRAQYSVSVLSKHTSETSASRDSFFSFFLSPDFHELWGRVMNISLITDIRQQGVMCVLGWVTI